MANTYSQFYIKIVFAVKGRVNCIPSKNREQLNKYITGIVQKQGHKMIAANCASNHIHVFIGLKPSITVSNIARDIKSISSKFINENKWMKGSFRWQEGYGAFSYSQSQIYSVVKYIFNQP